MGSYGPTLEDNVRKTLFLLMTALLVAGCAASPGPEPAAPSAAQLALDPVGTYNFTTTVQGMSVTGQAVIGGTRGSWTGSLYSDATGELPIRSVSVSGNQITMLADSPDGTVQIRMLMDGETFTGDWSLGAEGGTLRGRRVSR